MARLQTTKCTRDPFGLAAESGMTVAQPGSDGLYTAGQAPSSGGVRIYCTQQQNPVAYTLLLSCVHRQPLAGGT